MENMSVERTFTLRRTFPCQVKHATCKRALFSNTALELAKKMKFQWGMRMLSKKSQGRK